MGVLRYALRTKMDSLSLLLDKEAAAEDDKTTWGLNEIELNHGGCSGLKGS